MAPTSSRRWSMLAVLALLLLLATTSMAFNTDDESKPASSKGGSEKNDDPTSSASEKDLEKMLSDFKKDCAPGAVYTYKCTDECDKALAELQKKKLLDNDEQLKHLPSKAPAICACLDRGDELDALLVSLEEDNCYDPKNPHAVECSDEKDCPKRIEEFAQMQVKFNSECVTVSLYPPGDNTARDKQREEMETALLDMCNPCATKFADLEKLLTQIRDKGCDPTLEKHVCSPECINLTTQYQAETGALLREEICRPNMPGGCGIGGGMSEGKIYEHLLSDSFGLLMDRFNTLRAQCDPKCQAAYDRFYRSGVHVLARSKAGGRQCFTYDSFVGGKPGDKIDWRSKDITPAFAQLSGAAVACTEECLQMADDRILRRFFTMPSSCRIAAPRELYLNVRFSASSCTAPGGELYDKNKDKGLLGTNITANVVIVLSLFFSCVLASFCMVTGAVNYYRGYRGLDALPNIFYWKSLVQAARAAEAPAATAGSSTTNTTPDSTASTPPAGGRRPRRNNMNEDEEWLMFNDEAQ
ncbi:hypothetical protein H696_05121 [Fonticula alba]|uniref:Uncharacterized protein n=1 Tax=Fonticula alba TaxID=691883 RepID=A0A058Z3T9_FONAL|nr:hypothetical protein H696_05121 [Fonticula alba]KCV68192.1 hypothetical protein H696_05121 [Fonticula alba]|eukprot:XP_009497246.1 hypothetical protein H696_05121 [Fonticula alba]